MESDLDGSGGYPPIKSPTRLAVTYYRGLKWFQLQAVSTPSPSVRVESLKPVLRYLKNRGVMCESNLKMFGLGTVHKNIQFRFAIFEATQVNRKRRHGSHS